MALQKACLVRFPQVGLVESFSRAHSVCAHRFVCAFANCAFLLKARREVQVRRKKFQAWNGGQSSTFWWIQGTRDQGTEGPRDRASRRGFSKPGRKAGPSTALIALAINSAQDDSLN